MATTSRYNEVYGAWQRAPEEFWRSAAAGISWDKPWDWLFDPGMGLYGRWFVGGMLNTSFNYLDRHVADGRADRPALIWDSPMTGRRETFTYGQLLARTEKLAGALAARGVGKGDRVTMYMPIVPEAVISMLACRGWGRSIRWCSVPSRRRSWRRGARMLSRR